MKTQLSRIGCMALTVTAALAGSQRTQAQGTFYSTFTYQGRLDDLGGGQLDQPVSLRITAVIPPVPCFGTDCGWFTNCPDCLRIELGTNSVLVNKGLFTTAIVIPPPLLSNSNGLYLQFGVRTNGGGDFTTLWPAQQVTATPYASIAQSVSGPLQASNLIGTMPTGMLTGIFSSPVTFNNPGNVFVGDASLLTHIQASNLIGTMPTGMLTGTFSSPLTFNNPANVFAGDGSALVNVNATTIGGLSPCALTNCYWSLRGNGDTDPNVNFLGTTDNAGLTIGVANAPVLRITRPAGPAGSPNLVGGDAANYISSAVQGSVIGGGGSTANPNTILGDASVIAGGQGNHIERQLNFIGGGFGNSIDPSGGMPGPVFNVIGGGISNINSGSTSTIGGGGYNRILLNTQGDNATIAGGYWNLANGVFAAIAGGANNTAGRAGSVGGGWGNSATGDGSTVAGGWVNTASGAGAAIPGGLTNTASGSTSFAAGNRAKALHDGAFVWSDSQNADFASTANDQFAVRAQNGVMIQGTTTALDLRGDGAIRVAGAGVGSAGPVFIHRASNASVSGHITTIDHPLANGDPNAILLVTHNWSADTAANRYETTPVGVWYNGTQWTIFHEDTSVPMPVGRAFNVMIIKP